MKKIVISEMIRKYRESFHLNQDDLGEKINVSGKTISSWEVGRTEPNMGYVQKLADFFSISTDVLIYDYQELTEISMDNFIFDDYFPLRYCTNLSAGSFDELLDSEPDAIVYVPIIFQSKRKRLVGFKVNGTSMDNIIMDGSIVVVEQHDAIKYKDGTIVVVYCDGLTTVKRIYTKDDGIVLMPDSKDKSHMPIMISEDKQIYIIGKVIWHMNGEDISKYY